MVGDTALMYFNASGANRDVVFNLVSATGSAGNANRVGAATVATGSRTSMNMHATLSAGDVISVRSNSAASGQLFWVNVVEIP